MNNWFICNILTNILWGEPKLINFNGLNILLVFDSTTSMLGYNLIYIVNTKLYFLV